MRRVRSIAAVAFASVVLALSVSDGASARPIEGASVDDGHTIVLGREADSDTREAIAAALDLRLLRADTAAIMVRADGRVQQLDGNGEVVATTSGGWKKAVRVAKCIGAVGGLIAGNAVLVLKVRKLGGVAAVARRLVTVGSAEARWKAAAAFFGDVTGLTGVVSACG